MTDGIVGGIAADPPIGGGLGGGQGMAGPPGKSAYGLAGGDAAWGSLDAWLASLATGGVTQHDYAIAVSVVGQTVLPISPPPALLSSLVLTVNGIDYRAPGALTADRVAVTWLGAFRLDPSDDVHISYF